VLREIGSVRLANLLNAGVELQSSAASAIRRAIDSAWPCTVA
jgi:hypothetical protein